MFVDLWIVGLFSLLFGACAWWNHSAGVRKGIEATLAVLEQEKVIRFDNGDVVPYSKKKGSKNV
jgi:hypothetical protein